jgi:hypothetical protein
MRCVVAIERACRCRSVRGAQQVQPNTPQKLLSSAVGIFAQLGGGVVMANEFGSFLHTRSSERPSLSAPVFRRLSDAPGSIADERPRLIDLNR